VAVLPALLRQPVSETPGEKTANPATPEPPIAKPTASVRVEHEFVTLQVTPAPFATSPAAGRATAFRRDPFKPLMKVTAAEKARRAFLGDGRYRPEPFPRVR
jgi:hypothetical protein